MGKMLIFTVFLACYVSASEVSYVGVVPINKESETGMGLVLNADRGEAISFDTENIDVEIFYRRSYIPEVEIFDWGFSLAGINLASFPGTPDFIFDLKVRLLKGSNIIPSIGLGVNMLRFNDLDFPNLSFDPSFLDEGRIGLSWELISYDGKEKGKSVKVKRNIIYAGVNVRPGNSSFGDKYFVGAKFSNLGLVIVFQNDIRSISLGYSYGQTVAESSHKGR